MVSVLSHTPAHGQTDEVRIQEDEAISHGSYCDWSLLSERLFSTSLQLQPDKIEQPNEPRLTLNQIDDCEQDLVIRNLIKDLDIYQESQQRIKVAYVLGELGKCATATDTLSELCNFWGDWKLQDNDIETVVVALQQALLEQNSLPSPDLPFQEVAAEALGKFDGHAADALTDLIDALATVDSNQRPAYRVRDGAAYAIINIQASGNVDPTYISKLEDFLSKGDNDLKIRAAQILGHFGISARDSVSSLIENLIRDENLAVRESAAYAIEQIKIQNTEDIESLIDVFLSEDYTEDIRETSFRLLAFLDSPSEDYIESKIQELVNSEKRILLLLALWISAENEVGEQVFSVEKILSILRSEIRLSAIYFIGQTDFMIDKEVLGELVSIAQASDENAKVRELAILAISKISGSESNSLKFDAISTLIFLLGECWQQSDIENQSLSCIELQVAAAQSIERIIISLHSVKLSTHLEDNLLDAKNRFIQDLNNVKPDLESIYENDQPSLAYIRAYQVSARALLNSLIHLEVALLESDEQTVKWFENIFLLLEDDRTGRESTQSLSEGSNIVCILSGGKLWCPTND